MCVCVCVCVYVFYRYKRARMDACVPVRECTGGNLGPCVDRPADIRVLGTRMITIPFDQWSNAVNTIACRYPRASEEEEEGVPWR